MISNALADAGAQMRRAGNQIALVKVIRLHAAHEQFLHVRLHHRRVVVDVFEQDGLVAERNAGVGQAAQRVADFGRQFARMVRVNAHEERMKFFQHRAQFGRDALRQESRDARTDAQKFNVRNRAQPAQKIFQLVVAQQATGRRRSTARRGFPDVARCRRFACRIRDENRSRWRC